MGSQIDKLLEKYWNGETSLEEETLIKEHFKKNPALGNEGQYFRYLADQKKVSYEGSTSTLRKKTWLSAAATITIGLITAGLVFNDAKKDPFAIDDPEKALQATKEALLMIGSELKQGQDHTLELTKINKAKEELQDDS
ncbi:MAG: hypothetical protein HRT61_14130 [Ekhidna sp.]|nr:hypothetical protein [Ekhidna sp.]